MTPTSRGLARPCWVVRRNQSVARNGRILCFCESIISKMRTGTELLLSAINHYFYVTLILADGCEQSHRALCEATLNGRKRKKCIIFAFFFVQKRRVRAMAFKRLNACDKSAVSRSDRVFILLSVALPNASCRKTSFDTLPKQGCFCKLNDSHFIMCSLSTA